MSAFLIRQIQRSTVAKLDIVELHRIVGAGLNLNTALIKPHLVLIISVYQSVSVDNKAYASVIQISHTQSLSLVSRKVSVKPDRKIFQLHSRSKYGVAAGVKLRMARIIALINRLSVHIGVIPELCCHSGLAVKSCHASKMLSLSVIDVMSHPLTYLTPEPSLLRIPSSTVMVCVG